MNFQIKKDAIEDFYELIVYLLTKLLHKMIWANKRV